MVRWIVLCAALSACAPHSSSGPAWPTPHARASDGGESLAPRASATVAAIEDSDDEPKSDATPAAPAAATPATPAAPKEPGASPAGTAPTMIEEPTQIEDIVIEIDD
jgi:hypothetical protein